MIFWDSLTPVNPSFTYNIPLESFQTLVWTTISVLSISFIILILRVRLSRVDHIYEQYQIKSRISLYVFCIVHSESLMSSYYKSSVLTFQYNLKIMVISLFTSCKSLTLFSISRSHMSSIISGSFEEYLSNSNHSLFNIVIRLSRSTTAVCFVAAPSRKSST